jgi:hypothetical protein
LISINRTPTPKETIMDSKNENVEEGVESAIKGGRVSRRWLLKSSANLAAGTIAVSALGAANAEAKPAAAIEKPSTQHDPHANQQTAYHAAAFAGWESV